MARAETLDDLLAPILAQRRITDWCADASLSPWTIRRMRAGAGTRTHAGTVLAMVAALSAAGIQADADRVRRAIAASRRAAKRRQKK